MPKGTPLHKERALLARLDTANMTVQEITDYIGLPKSRVHSMLCNNKIPYKRINKKRKWEPKPQPAHKGKKCYAALKNINTAKYTVKELQRIVGWAYHIVYRALVDHNLPFVKYSHNKPKPQPKPTGDMSPSSAATAARKPVKKRKKNVYYTKAILKLLEGVDTREHTMEELMEITKCPYDVIGRVLRNEKLPYIKGPPRKSVAYALKDIDTACYSIQELVEMTGFRYDTVGRHLRHNNLPFTKFKHCKKRKPHRKKHGHDFVVPRDKDGKPLLPIEKYRHKLPRVGKKRQIKLYV